MRRQFWTVVLLALGAGGSWFAGQLFSEDLPPAKQPARDTATLNVRIAEASLKLAENELQVLLSANERLRNAFPKTVVDRARLMVNVAKQQVATADKNEPYANYVGLSKAEWQALDAQYRAAQAANQQVDGAVAPLEMAHLKIQTELAQLRYERAQTASSVPETTVLGWQLEDLRDRVRRLAHQLELYRGNE